MSIWRFLAYLLGAIVLFLSKALVPLAMYGLSRLLNLPANAVTYLLGKGPPLVTGLIFILFGLDLLLMKRTFISNETGSSTSKRTRQDEHIRFKPIVAKRSTTDRGEKQIREVRFLGGSLLIVGLVLLLLSLAGPLTADYSESAWPPLPYP